MLDPNGIFLGASRHGSNPEKEGAYIWLKYANRHGFIAGATGTGKTVTLQVLAESFSKVGVPVFCADVKGDLSGIAKAGIGNEKITTRAKEVGLDSIEMCAAPVIFWDIFGESGHPVRTTVSEMGPLLLARLMNLTPAQEGILNITFRLADEEGLLLLDLKDLQSMLGYVGEQAANLSTRYGNVSKVSVGAIQRELLVLETQGGAKFFGEPALKLADIMRTTTDGRGMVNVLAADKLMNSPRLYSTFLLWLMSELFEKLPEIGDPEKPRLVFFFDEAHLLFDNAPKALVDRIEQVVRLIRSKGVGIYFISQSPADMPDSILAQLSNRVQHALRAYTPREMAAVKTAAATFRPNPEFDTLEALTQLATGEALVSTLAEKGAPSIVQRTMIRPPVSQIGPLTSEERRTIMAQSPVAGQYDEMVDRDSAHEILAQRMEERLGEVKRKTDNKTGNEAVKEGSLRDEVVGTIFGDGKSGGRQSVVETVLKSAGRSLVKVCEDYLRRILDTFLGGKKTGSRSNVRNTSKKATKTVLKSEARSLAKVGEGYLRGILGGFLGGEKTGAKSNAKSTTKTDTRKK